MKILIIDDSEDDRLLYRRSLQSGAQMPFEIIESADGDEGLERIQDSAPDCTLLDYSLPGRNGVEVLKRIRVQHPFMPVVMLTGQGNESIAVAAIREGAQNYITKSTITPEAIQRIVRVAVEHCEMEKRIHDQRAALEIFTRALAHDLKEPVRTIKSFLDLMATREHFSEKGRNYFNYIKNAADRMGALIDTVYFYTRLDGSEQQIVREACKVEEVLEEAQENISQLIRERNAVISCGELPEVYINRMQLLQVLQNLMCNAIHHGGAEPRIDIHAERRGEEWVIEVSDNGPGVEEAYREQIFEPFKRATRTRERGLGLGLAICRKIIESCGGRIWYEPAEGGGAAFLFTLPSALPASRSPADVTSQPMAAGNGNMASILLVEDSDADIELTKIMLLEREQMQCQLLVAHDGFEALAMLQAEEIEKTGIDLILLDINMPGMDGFDLLRKMNGFDPHRRIPVVMCTTSTYDKDMEKAKSLGAVGYVNKPADLHKLRPVLEQLPNVRLCRQDQGYVLLRAA